MRRQNFLSTVRGWLCIALVLAASATLIIARQDQQRRGFDVQVWDGGKEASSARP
ncbi:hypothetical protein PbB2_01128 [Candidatus Phycosocius bacilliformis]|uniref:Uncharacterized protein n=1 Tax=Candidatus Phycosocius bacilliformis TaxID=1445552 RepID=A0A2P2E8U0_9PROT|nr:hypothetical protein [Candidatus Phycosocius bacilliformis]GBF57461.1 hypothetical protein PbB2_01128 [Candidatus Phycosocius bacilliformis]